MSSTAKFKFLCGFIFWKNIALRFQQHEWLNPFLSIEQRIHHVILHPHFFHTYMYKFFWSGFFAFSSQAFPNYSFNLSIDKMNTQ